MNPKGIKIILFDTFGTVTDWHSTVVQEGEKLAETYGFQIDWPVFANRWRDEGYMKAIFEFAQGAREWEPVDQIHFKKLNSLFQEYGIDGISESDLWHFNLLWHRLLPWPDSRPGLTRLKEAFMISPFTNGDFPLIANMSKHAGLPWDFIITANIFKKFKPEPSIYRDALEFVGCSGEEVLMVAAHPFDLDGAKAAGCRTAFVPRPLEYGMESSHMEPLGKTEPDFVAKDFIDLSGILLGS